MLKINLNGLLWGFMVLIMIVMEDFYGASWLVCLVDGIFHNALGEILMSLVFLVRDWVKPIFV